MSVGGGDLTCGIDLCCILPAQVSHAGLPPPRAGLLPPQAGPLPCKSASRGRMDSVDRTSYTPYLLRILDDCASPLLQDLKPELVYARISGYGQTGPKASLPGYASVCEAYGGFR